MVRPLDWYKGRTNYTSIRGMSDIRRLPRYGKIRLGIKEISKKTGKEYPKDVDYFVVPPEVEAIYGPHPKQLDVYIPCEEKDLFFPHALKWYAGGGRLRCKGDGTTATRIQDDGTMHQIECTCEHYGVDCFPRASLMVILHKVRAGGVYQIDTGSVTNIISIQSAVDYLQNFLIGRIAYVPLKLKRVPQSIPTPDGKMVVKALLALEFEGSIEDVAYLRRKDAIEQITAAAPMKELPPAPMEEMPDDSPVIEVSTAPETTIPKDITPPDAKEMVLGPRPNYNEPAEEPKPEPEPMREPGADEAEEEPFPLEEPQKNMVVEKIASVLKESNSIVFLKARWDEMVVKNKDLSPMEKVILQGVFLEAERKLKKK